MPLKNNGTKLNLLNQIKGDSKLVIRPKTLVTFSFLSKAQMKMISKER
jgi:hypothetical protein